MRADARALPFRPAFDLVVSFGAFGHFLPHELPGLFSGVHGVLRPGGRFAFPVMAPPRPGSIWYWALLGFDTVMRVRNAVRRPTFVMYYRTFRLGDVERELARAGFRTELYALNEFGRRRDGSPRARMVVATREDTPREDPRAPRDTPLYSRSCHEVTSSSASSGRCRISPVEASCSVEVPLRTQKEAVVSTLTR